MPNSFDPRKYQDSGARFQAWQAAGSPGEDMYGNALDTRGEVANLMFDPNYVAANKNSFSNYNGKSDWLQTYFSPQNQGLQSFMRQGGVVDPWAKTFMGNNPSGGGQVPGGVSMPGPTPQPMTAPPGGGVSMPAPNPIPHGGPTVAGPTRPAGAELPNPVNRQPPPSPITNGTLPRGGGSTGAGPTLGSRGFSSQSPILIAGGANQGQPSYAPPINVAGGPKAGTPTSVSSVGKDTSGQMWHGGDVFAYSNTGAAPNNSTSSPTSGAESYYGPTYQDYLAAWSRDNAPDDSGHIPAPRLTEEQWNQLSPYERHQNVAGTGLQTPGYDVAEDDPLFQQFYQQFGHNSAIENSGFELGNQRQTGLAVGYDSGNNGVAGPGYGRLDWNQYALDPSRIMWIDPPGTPGRRYVYERSNARGDAVAGEQHRESNSGLGDNAGLIMAGLVLGGGFLGNALLPGTVGAEAGAGAVAGAEAGAGAVAGAGAGAGSIPSWIASQLPAGVTASQFFSALRTAGSVVGAIRMLTGQGGGGSGSSGGSGGNNSGGGGSGSSGGSGGNNSGGGDLGSTIADLIQGGLSNYQANRNIGSYNEMLNEMLLRGDPYAPERARAITRLRALEDNPGSVTSNPLFQSMNDKSQADLQRIFAARGLNISGNEMGGLQENFLANMNKFYGEEWNRIAREAGVFFDPGQIAAAGMQGAGRMFGARQNRDMVSNAVLRRILGSGGGGLNISNIVDFVNNLFGGGSDGGDSGNDGEMSDEEWSNWWDSWIEGNYGGDNPVGDAGDYNG